MASFTSRLGRHLTGKQRLKVLHHPSLCKQPPILLQWATSVTSTSQCCWDSTISLTHPRGQTTPSKCNNFLWTLCNEPVMYTGPPLTKVARAIPHPIPPISALVTSIINSANRLFFVSHLLGNPSVHEWRLVRVALSDSTSILPSCLQDGRFLVKFFTLHYGDIHFNATNQHYWRQYHPAGNITTPTSLMTTHLIRPSETSKALAKQQNLVPFCRWLNLTHTDTYIHGLFNFATVNGCKSHDHISQYDCDILI
jgi:hypothetical protein